MAREYVHLDVVFIKVETEKAFLCVLLDGKECWIPKSVIADSEDYDQGDQDAVVSVQDWFAEKEGLS